MFYTEMLSIMGQAFHSLINYVEMYAECPPGVFPASQCHNQLHQYPSKPNINMLFVNTSGPAPVPFNKN